MLDPSPISLNLTATAGAGNLLDNLLCGMTGLLGPQGFLNTLVGTPNQLRDLLDLTYSVM